MQIATLQEAGFAKRPKFSAAPAGQKVRLSTNFFSFKLKSSNFIYVYAVKFEEDIPADNTPLRKKVVRTIREQLEKIYHPYIFTGALLFSPQSSGAEPVRLETAEAGTKYRVEFRQAHMISLADILSPHKEPEKAITATQFLNIIVKSLLGALNMFPVGRTGKYLLPSGAIQMNDYGLEIWPGYKTSVRLLESGLLLEIDYTSRILRQQTVLAFMRDIQRSSHGDYRQQIKEALVDKSVLARYGNKKNYKVIDIDFGLNPATHKFTTPEGEITMDAYFLKKYRLTIKDKSQPLIVSSRLVQNKDRSMREEKLYLAPELCSMTGLPDEIREDHNSMRDIARYTKLTPNDRTQKMQELLRALQQTNVSREAQVGDRVSKQVMQQPAKIMADWNLQIDSSPSEVEGRILPHVTLTLGGKQTLPVGENGQFFFKQPIVTPLPLDNWILVHTGKDKATAENFVEVLYKASATFGIKVEYPRYEEASGIRAQSLIEAAQRGLRSLPKPQVIVFILPPPAINEYRHIKKWATTQNPPIITQVIKTKTLGNQKGLMAVCSKVILQINSKRNGDLWRVGIPPTVPKKTMLVGIDVSREGPSTFLGFASTYDPFFCKYYTQIQQLHPKQEISSTLASLFVRALQRFLEETKKFLPELIIIYRDGVGETQKKLLFEVELKSMVGGLEQKFPKYEPKLIFATVNKKIHMRFFAHAGGAGGARGGRRGYGEEQKQGLMNPQPGTVVDKGIVDTTKYEFLLMPQFVNEGTGTPAKFHVMYDTSEMPPETFEELTNALCYGYDNWQGAIRTPAPCKYALSHAKLASKYTRAPPDDHLLSYKYFL